jgi:hypothetical protein
LENSLVASVKYTSKPTFSLEEGCIDACEEHSEESAQLMDISRPLEADCELELHDFSDPRGKMAFWHSSAHLLGQALE